MATKLKIKVVEGKKIRDPKTGAPLPTDRAVTVDGVSYWLRRIKAGDVVLVDDAKKQEPKKIEKVEKPMKKMDEKQKPMGE